MQKSPQNLCTTSPWPCIPTIPLAVKWQEKLLPKLFFPTAARMKDEAFVWERGSEKLKRSISYLFLFRCKQSVLKQREKKSGDKKQQIFKLLTTLPPARWQWYGGASSSLAFSKINERAHGVRRGKIKKRYKIRMPTGA